MKLRPPAIPLITIDPYFSVWSSADCLTDSTTEHWTGSPNTLLGTVTVDGETFGFLGKSGLPVMEQIHFDLSALVTEYVFANEKIILSAAFFSSLLPNDLERLSRPVSYLRLRYESADGGKHNVSVKLAASEEFCINKRGEISVAAECVTLADGICAGKIGSLDQQVLNRSGDDLRIDWGYFYLCGAKGSQAEVLENDGMTFVSVSAPLTESLDTDFAFAYDDIKSIRYFGEALEGYWKADGKTIEQAITEALRESDEIFDRCRDFAERLYDEAETAGGEQYAELCSLAYRQVMAAHKLVRGPEGEVLFLSKECFSNACVATVDVTYPSSPMFLLYNPELLKGMLRPIFRFAASKEWVFDFAPHDIGTYPLANGQAYNMDRPDGQMPVEECGNMLIMMANIARMEGNADFAKPYMELLEGWVKYLERYGEDPENQLCTDDFAGHLAHNCNLSLKAILGIVGYSTLLEMLGRQKEAQAYRELAGNMADHWVKRAANEDGSFRLAFDKPDTFSMKYNIVWDKLWGTGLFAPCVTYSEFCSNKKHINCYGMPLDNRARYTKSDWLVWTAMLAPTKEEFADFIEPLWRAYHCSPSRVPMTDWYDTVTSLMWAFRHRSVMGGLFIKLLEGRI